MHNLIIYIVCFNLGNYQIEICFNCKCHTLLQYFFYFCISDDFFINCRQDTLVNLKNYQKQDPPSAGKFIKIPLLGT